MCASCITIRLSTAPRRNFPDHKIVSAGERFFAPSIRGARAMSIAALKLLRLAPAIEGTTQL